MKKKLEKKGFYDFLFIIFEITKIKWIFFYAKFKRKYFDLI